MNTSQIQCCIDCSIVLRPYIIGVFAADQLPIKLDFPCGFIANTDTQNEAGRHWCCFYFPNSNTVEYFDSYGKSVNYYNNPFPRYVSNFSTIIANSKQLQSPYSDICGMYCLFFLWHRLNGISFSNIINMFSNIYDCNDLFVYRFVSYMFEKCVINRCVYNQICKPLIKRV